MFVAVLLYPPFLPFLLPMNMTFRLFCSLCITFALLHPAPGSAQGERAAERAFSRGDPVPGWVRPAAALPAAAASGALSIRLADLQFYVAEQSTLYTRRAITAHEASSLAALGQIEIEFQPEYQRVQLHKLHILRGRDTQDRLSAASIRFLQRETGLERGVYSGAVTAAIVTEDVRVGDTLDIEYSIVGQNPVFEGAFFHAASWDAPYPVAWRRVRVNNAPGLPIHYRLIGADARASPQPIATTEAGRQVLTFEGRNLPAQIAESAVPSDVHPYRWLQFSQYDSWSAVNDWARRLFAYKGDAAALQPALPAARAAGTQAEAVARVVEFVQSEIRYLSVSLGQNSHRPSPPAQVLARRYGDCKDKTLLMVAMLRELGIDAVPVLASTTLRKGLTQLLPSPMPFDHAIVRVTVGGVTHYIDPTLMGQRGPLERMGQAHGGNEVLPIAPGSAQLQTIAHPAELPVYKRSERVTVAVPGQPADMTVQLDMRGADAEAARVRLRSMSQDEKRRAFDSLLVKRYPDAQLLGEPTVRDDLSKNTVSIMVRYRIGQLMTDQGEFWSARYTPSNMSEVFHASGGGRRNFPHAIPNAPSQLVYEFEMTLPNGPALPASEQTTKVDNPAFRFVQTSTVAGRVYRGNATFVAIADRVAPEAMPTFLADVQKMSDAMGSGFRVYKDVPRAEAPPPAQSTSARLQASLAGIDLSIADAQLAGRDTSAALCERALLLAYLGKSAEALRDADKAVTIQPLSPDLMRCRAEVKFVVGKLRESEADYSRAIAQGAQGAGPYFGRALSSLLLGNAAAARGDFDVAVSKAEGLLRTRALILSTVASVQENGAAIVPATHSAPDVDAAWLGSVPGMLAGEHTPDHVVGLASRNAGPELDARLTEAYYYGGKYYALKRDKLRARAWLQRAVDKNLPNNLFAIAARHELARLSQ